jgi:hypothetical protein
MQVCVTNSDHTHATWRIALLVKPETFYQKTDAVLTTKPRQSLVVKPAPNTSIASTRSWGILPEKLLFGSTTCGAGEHTLENNSYQAAFTFQLLRQATTEEPRWLVEPTSDDRKSSLIGGTDAFLSSVVKDCFPCDVFSQQTKCTVMTQGCQQDSQVSYGILSQVRLKVSTNEWPWQRVPGRTQNSGCLLIPTQRISLPLHPFALGNMMYMMC